MHSGTVLPQETSVRSLSDPRLASHAQRHELVLGHIARGGEAGVVQQRLGIEEHARAARLSKAALSMPGGVAGRRRQVDVESRHVRHHRLEGMRVERAQPRAVAAAGDHHDHRRGPFSVRSASACCPARRPAGCRPCGRKSANCNERHGPVAGHRPADRGVPTIVDSDSGELRTRLPNSVLSPLSDAEHVALGVLDVLAVQHHPRVARPNPTAEHFPERVLHGQLGGPVAAALA